jgi:hypothetical protein
VGISGTYAALSGDSGRSTYLGKADALRHCLWSAYMGYMLGEHRAKLLGDAHEMAVTPTDRDQAIEREMDLHNNRVGRILGVSARNTVFQAFALPFMTAAAKGRLSDGALRIIDTTDSGYRLVSSDDPNIP